MFEVKYPNTDELDGKVHLIQIEKAYEVVDGNKKNILLYGQENGRIVTLVLRYISDIQEYVYIPCNKMELLNITSPHLERKEITEELIEELRGKKVKNILEVHSLEKIVNYEKQVNSISGYDQSDIRNVQNNGNDNVHKEMVDSSKEGVDWQNIMDLFTVYKKKSLALLGDFILENTNKYQSTNIELEVLKLVNNLLNTIKNMSDVLYTEDDLIDVGSLLAKLQFKRVNSLKIDEFEKIIFSGHELCDRLSLRISKNTK